MSRPSSKPNDAGKESERGFILVAVLWILSALAVLSAVYSIYVSNAAVAAHVTDDGVNAEAAVRAGVELVAYELTAAPDSSGSAQPAAAPQSSGSAQLTAASESSRPAQGGFAFRLGRSRIKVSFIAEGARIDLNAAPKKLLVGLFEAIGAKSEDADAFADRIVGWLLETRARVRGDGDNGGTYFYQLLHAAGFFPAGAPPRARMLSPRVHGQKSAGQLIDRYGLTCRPVRDLLVDYLNERRPGIDYVTLGDLAYQLGMLFWKDLETHHPGIDSLDLAPDVAVAWKQRMQYRTVQTTAPGGERTRSQVPRLSVVDHLTTIRSFYLDIAEWAADDPSRWAQWAVPCPVRPAELTHRQALTRRKSRSDQRTRERLPVLPRLVAAAGKERADAASRLAAAAAAAPGQEFTAGGQTLVRATFESTPARGSGPKARAAPGDDAT